MSFLYGKNLRANNIRQHYLRYGGVGPKVVVIPGIVSPAALWDHVGRFLGATHDCYILDVRGRGLSESGPHLDYGFDACAQDLLAFVETLGLSSFSLVGHSMGARIALRAARLRCAAMERLVLLDPPTSGPGRRPYPIPAARTLALLDAAKRGEAEQALRDPSQLPWPEDLLLRRAEWLHTCDERAVHVAYEEFHQQDMFADLAGALPPTTLLCAGHGGVVSDEDAREMQRLQAGLQWTRLAHAGHQMQVDDFESFRAALAMALGMPAQTEVRM